MQNINRISANINEIQVAKLLNNNKFPNEQAEEVFYQSKERLNNQIKFDEMICKASLQAEYIHKKYIENSKKRFLKSYWTGQNFSISHIIKNKISDKQCPADVLLEYQNDDFFGISLKTSLRHDSFNLGDYSLYNFLEMIDLSHLKTEIDYSIYEGVLQIVPELKGLTLSQRNKYLKHDSKSLEIVNAYSDRKIEQSRDELTLRLNQLLDENENLLKAYFMDYFLNKSGYDLLKYTQISATGDKDFKICEDDSRERIDLIKNAKKLYIESLGYNAIGVKTCTDRVFKLYLKYKDRKLTGAPCLKVEKWLNPKRKTTKI